MIKTIKMLSDMTKKDVEKCLVRMWFALTDHINIIQERKKQRI